MSECAPGDIVVVGEGDWLRSFHTGEVLLLLACIYADIHNYHVLNSHGLVRPAWIQMPNEFATSGVPCTRICWLNHGK